MTPSKAKMEEELFAGGWTQQLSESDWKAPNGHVYTGVEYCWRILKGDQFSKGLIWGQKKN
jgi:hypothetical protein